MERKKLFEPGTPVVLSTGQAGVVISREVLQNVSSRLKEGRRPGHYFAPGCCHNPDYVTQVPVLFEDGTYDVMRAMYVRRAAALPAEKKARIEGFMDSEEEGPFQAP